MSAAQVENDEDKTARKAAHRAEMRRNRKTKEVERRQVLTLEDATSWFIREVLTVVPQEERALVVPTFPNGEPWDATDLNQMAAPRIMKHLIMVGLGCYGYEYKDMLLAFKKHQLEQMQKEINELDEGTD